MWFVSDRLRGGKSGGKTGNPFAIAPSDAGAISLQKQLEQSVSRSAMRELRLLLGDQLNVQHSWFQQIDDEVLYLIAELPQEMRYVRHHIQKACAFMAAMSQFATALQKAGHQVCYLTLDDTAAFPDLPALITHIMVDYDIRRFAYQRPDEYRLCQQLADFSPAIKGYSVTMAETEHFMLPLPALPQYFGHDDAQTKPPVMEFFYRQLRQRFGILMEQSNGQSKPLGGQWNYDQDNRNKLKAADLADIPEPLLFANDVSLFAERLRQHGVKTIGKLDESSGQATLTWPINRRQARALLAAFCAYGLPQFGRFQDAMTANSPRAWSLYHSRLSFALNTKMLSPAYVIRQAINHFEANRETIDLAQIEGFIRQILGWREYMRGIYWRYMPDYAQKNALEATRKLPNWFWTGKTNMRCLQATISQSLDHAYAHHIQRLMVTGNFCLIAGIDPDAVDAWYLGIYIDAIEWVELPNTRGMSQFADGGMVATKPYAASGNYINKMSDYCKDCTYTVSKKAVNTTTKTCPLNSLYWHFMVTHRDRLIQNPRIGMIYRNWDKQKPEQQQATLENAQWYLENIEAL